MTDSIKRLKELVDSSDNIVFFGGAGVSTEDSQLARWTVKDGHCKAGGICCQLIGRSYGAVWGQSRILFGIVQPWPHEPHDSKRSGFDALYHADYRWPVSFSVFTC